MLRDVCYMFLKENECFLNNFKKITDTDNKKQGQM